MKFKAQWDYMSSYGSFTEGSVVDLPEEEAEAINRDSPGVLKPVKGGKAEEEAEADRAPDGPPADRMARRRRKRGQGGGEGPITKDDFKATKDPADETPAEG